MKLKTKTSTLEPALVTKVFIWLPPLQRKKENVFPIRLPRVARPAINKEHKKQTPPRKNKIRVEFI